jgi:putative methyltransferase (TIGR04325 family)
MIPINKKLKFFLRRWIPQGVRDLLNRFSGHAIYYRGRFVDWPSAKQAAGGYDEGQLITRLVAAATAVKNGNAAWEQDGVTWSHIPPDMPVFAAVARVALARNGRLSVLDFGGGMGSSYLQCRSFLPESVIRSWAVVEQPALVEVGQRDIARDALQFYHSIEEAVTAGTPDLALFSSVLQYLEDPWSILDRILLAEIPYLIIDRHPSSMTHELITVQVVPPSLYKASYPTWLFDCPRMLERLGEHYELLASWEGKDPAIRGWGMGAQFRGYFFKRYGAA